MLIDSLLNSIKHGAIVRCKTNEGAYGTYLGKVQNIVKIRPDTFNCNVEILALLEYPSQKAIFFYATKERKPYEYKSIQSFSLENVEIHASGMAEEYFDENVYNKSIQIALMHKLNSYGVVDDTEKAILLDHLTELRKSKVLKG